MLPRPPTSTLFPYTTLFRSKAFPKKFESVCTALTATLFAHNVAPARVFPTPADRKSTRLNSSHSQISYAVFCLKKKKFQHLRQGVLVWQLVARGSTHWRCWY